MRRYLRFRLRTLFVLTTLAAVLLAMSLTDSGPLADLFKPLFDIEKPWPVTTIEWALGIRL